MNAILGSAFLPPEWCNFVAGVALFAAALAIPMPGAPERRIRISVVAVALPFFFFLGTAGISSWSGGTRLIEHHVVSLSILLGLTLLAWSLQSALHQDMEARAAERTDPVREEIQRGEQRLIDLARRHEERQGEFHLLTRRFNFVRSFGASLRFDVAWKEIEKGTQALLGTTPRLYLPRLPGAIPTGIFPYREEESTLLDTPEWKEAIGGRRLERAAGGNRRSLWVPLPLGDGQCAVVQFTIDLTVPGEAIEIFTTQIGLLIEKMRLYHEVELQSRTDLMTGLPHHACFKAIIGEELERSRNALKPLSLLMIDVDHFKAVNDTLGHLVGDQVLIHVSQKIRQMLRISDVVARYGGEEFAVILPETPPDGAQEIAERIRAAVEELPMLVRTDTEEKTIRKTVSIGVATFPSDGENQADLSAAADAALYRAKREGRNLVIASSGQNIS